MREATLQIVKESQPLIDGDITDDTEKAIFNGPLVTLNTANIAQITQTNNCFSLSIPSIKAIEPTTTISFKKPTKLVDTMKKIMRVSTNKDVGITAFDYYFKRECDDDE